MLKKITLVLVAVIVGLFALAMIVLHSSYVQNKIIGMVTEALSEKLQTEIQIEHVGLNLLGQRVSIQGIRIKDQHKRELLLVKELWGNFRFRPLLSICLLAVCAGIGALFFMLKKKQDAKAPQAA